jgi:hypothetical protein
MSKLERKGGLEQDKTGRRRRPAVELGGAGVEKGEGRKKERKLVGDPVK